MLSDETHSRHKAFYLPKRMYKVPSGTGSAFSLDLRHHMLVAGKVLARARTPVLKSQHLSQQHPATPLPLEHFPSVPNFALSLSPMLVLHLKDNTFILSATHT